MGWEKTSGNIFEIHCVGQIRSIKLFKFISGLSIFDVLVYVRKIKKDKKVDGYLSNTYPLLLIEGENANEKLYEI